MGRFSEIVARVEKTRLHFGMNKSRFSAAIGMSPQTYNNFIGAQGSKPNVELLHGIVHRFSVNPLWLLTGDGNMFLFEPADNGDVSTGADAPLKANSAESRLSVFESLAMSPHFVKVADLISKVELQFAQSQTEHVLLLNRVSRAVGHYLAQYPEEAKGELTALLERIESRLSDGLPRN